MLKDKYLWLTLGLSIFAVAPLFYPGYFQTHSGFIPLWSVADLKENIFNFAWRPVLIPFDPWRSGGLLPYYLAALLPLPALTAVKAVSFIGILAGSSGLYLWLKSWIGAQGASIAALVYTYAPFTITALYVRGAWSEAFFWGALPWALLAATFLVGTAEGGRRKAEGGRQKAEKASSLPPLDHAQNKHSSFILPPSSFRLHPSFRWIIFFWLGVGLLAMILAFGANTFLYPLFYLLTPGFDAVRQQERIFLVYAFAAAVLSGYGALALSSPLSRFARRRWQAYQRGLYWAGGAALALTGLYIYGATASAERGDAVNLFYGVLRHHIFGLIIFGGGLLLFALRPKRLWRRWWGMLLIAAWLAFNLFSVNWQFNLEERSPGTPFTPNGVSQFLIEHAANQPQPVRIASGGWLNGGNNAASVYGLEDITGNTPLQLRDAAAFAEAMPAWRYWQLMNVLYVVDTRDIDSPGLARRYEADGVKVFEVGDPFPRARIVHRVIVGDDIGILARDETDLKTTALLMTPGGQRLAVSGQPSTVAQVVESRPGLLVVDADTSAEGLLVLSNIYYPGWRAKLDGAPVEIQRVNGIFQGVFLPAGRHQVDLRFEPASFQWGAWISLAGLLLMAGVVAGGFKNSRFRTKISLLKESKR